MRIFGELDTQSLCSAAQTCWLWHDIIEQSEPLWRRLCLLVRAVCQREVDGDRRDGLSWKVSMGRVLSTHAHSVSTYRSYYQLLLNQTCM